MEKQFLFIMSQPPGSSLHAQEMLDMILTTAAFDQTVRLLFIDQAVFLLKKNQRLDLIFAKNTVPIFDALQMYDIEDLYVESESLEAQGLSPQDLCIDIKLLGRSRIGGWIAQHDVVVNA